MKRLYYNDYKQQYSLLLKKIERLNNDINNRFNFLIKRYPELLSKEDNNKIFGLNQLSIDQQLLIIKNIETVLSTQSNYTQLKLFK